MTNRDKDYLDLGTLGSISAVFRFFTTMTRISPALQHITLCIYFSFRINTSCNTYTTSQSYLIMWYNNMNRLGLTKRKSFFSQRNIHSQRYLICTNYVDVLFHQYLFVETLWIAVEAQFSQNKGNSFINSSNLIEFQTQQPATNQHSGHPLSNTIIMFGLRKSNSQSIILASMELIMVALKQ